LQLAPQHGVDLDQILKNADLAMYAAKSAGTPDLSFLRAMDARVRARRILEVELRQAINRRGAGGLLSTLHQSFGTTGSPAARPCCAGGTPNAARSRPPRFIPIAERHRPDQSAGRMGSVDDGLRGKPRHGPRISGSRSNVSPVQFKSGTFAFDDRCGACSLRPCGEQAWSWRSPRRC